MATFTVSLNLQKRKSKQERISRKTVSNTEGKKWQWFCWNSINFSISILILCVRRKYVFYDYAINNSQEKDEMLLRAIK